MTVLKDQNGGESALETAFNQIPEQAVEEQETAKPSCDLFYSTSKG